METSVRPSDDDAANRPLPSVRRGAGRKLKLVILTAVIMAVGLSLMLLAYSRIVEGGEQTLAFRIRHDATFDRLRDSVVQFHSVNIFTDDSRRNEVLEATARLRTHPRDADAYARRGWAYEELGRPAEALADFNEAIRLAPRTGVLYLWRWEYDRRHGDAAAAAKDLATAASLGAELSREASY